MINENTPKLWSKILPLKQRGNHKYDSGCAIIYGAPEMTGATRLAAAACARVGAGLVMVLSVDKTYDVYRGSLPAHIIIKNDLSYKHQKMTARLYGSGGVPCEIDYNMDIPTIIDAEGLKTLPPRLNSNYILTPHEGEFENIFSDIAGDKVEKALAAAKKINAIIVLKGAETIVAHPDGRTVINTHAVPNLATAGTGDVLAGMITGLVAQGMAPFEASCAGVWMHGEAGIRFGSGLVASDIELLIPNILTNLIDNIENKKLGFL